MKIQVFPISVTEAEAGHPHIGEPAQLTAYLLDNNTQAPDRLRPAIIICPGGGYTHLSSRENQAIAMQYLAMGLQTFVLEYSIAPNTFPYALMEMAKSVALVREHHAEWHIKPDCILISGFSAGGHAALSLGVFWHRSSLCEALQVDAEQIKPNGMILCYPVISSGDKCHPGSFQSLLGDNCEDAKMRELLSLEKQVTEQTPRTFLWHTWTDQTVPVLGSLKFALACEQAGVNLEMHIYPQGKHGLALADLESCDSTLSCMEPQCQNWIQLAKTWISTYYL